MITYKEEIKLVIYILILKKPNNIIIEFITNKRKKTQINKKTKNKL